MSDVVSLTARRAKIALERGRVEEARANPDVPVGTHADGQCGGPIFFSVRPPVLNPHWSEIREGPDPKWGEGVCWCGRCGQSFAISLHTRVLDE